MLLFQRQLNTLRITRLTGLLLGLSLCQTSVADQYSYSIDGAAIPLELHNDRILILSDNARSVLQLADDLNLESSNPNTSFPQGWSEFIVPDQSRSKDAVRELVTRINANVPDAFVSLWMSNPFGQNVLIQPELILAFDAAIEPDAKAVLLEGIDGDITTIALGNMPETYHINLRAANGFDVLNIANELSQAPGVRFADPGMLFVTPVHAVIPNDPLFDNCWALQSTGQDIFAGTAMAGGLLIVDDFDMDAPEAWDITTGDPSVTYVIFDQGTQLDHPDLLIDGSLGKDFSGEGGGGYPVNVCDRHGTAMAGLVSGIMNNELGITGLSPHVRLGCARIQIASPPDSTGACPASALMDPQWLVNGLVWAEELGARVTSHSYVIPLTDATLQKLQQTYEDGMIHFTSAGNQALSFLPYPEDFVVHSVSALDPFTGALAWFATFGDGLDYSAPGVSVLSTDRTGDDGYVTSSPSGVTGNWAYLNGSSMSCPLVASTAALMLSANPDLTVQDIESILQQSSIDLGPDGYDTFYGWGSVNAFVAVVAARDFVACEADLNGDGLVGRTDLAQLLGTWGAAASSPADFDSDGIVGPADLALLLGAWGPCG